MCTYAKKKKKKIAYAKSGKLKFRTKIQKSGKLPKKENIWTSESKAFFFLVSFKSVDEGSFKNKSAFPSEFPILPFPFSVTQTAAQTATPLTASKDFPTERCGVQIPSAKVMWRHLPAVNTAPGSLFCRRHRLIGKGLPMGIRLLQA
ncbi:hypothetical protein LXL04_027846 [Taraxacum kok-saghyz]